MVAAVSHPPVLIGRYAIFEEIARGGMATVHIGRLCGPGGFTRTVAVKRLHPGYASNPEFVAMFLDEARLAARIAHPNVVATLDVVAAKGELFMVMEYVHGESLSNLLRAARTRGDRVPVEISTQIAANVLLGLHAAHEATSPEGAPLGLVHRDVSPQNVLVGADGVARLIDFGVAKAVQRMRETRDGSVKGKVSYMSPEQLSGMEVDRRTDIWATSVILWEALAGRRLFDYEELGAIIAAALGGGVEPPSKHNPDVSPALDTIVMKGLAVRPDDRWSTAQEMALALEEAIPPIAPRTIAKWVEATAEERLRKKADIISRTEHTSLVLDGGPVASSLLSGDGVEPTSTEPKTSTESRTSTGDVSSALLEPAPPAGEAPRRRPVAFVLAALGALGAVGVVLIVIAVVRKTPEEHVSAGISASTTAPGTAPPSDEPEDEPAGAASDPGEATATAATTKTSGRGPAHRPARGEKASRSATAPSAPAPATAAPTTPLPTPAETSAAPAPSPPPPPPPAVTTTPPPARPRYVLASARVDVGAATNTLGTSAVNVGRAISPVAGRMTECYRAALPSATGEVEGPGKMHIGTDEDGVIVKVQVSSPVPAATPCIVAVVSGRRIPNVDTGRARADVPLLFRAQ
jgi:serine/threonine-protein kinase